MFQRMVSPLVLLLFLASPVEAQRSPTGTAPGQPLEALDGDHPLTTLEGYDGNFNARMMVNAHDAVADPSGTFLIEGLPALSTMQRAWFYTTSFNENSAETASVTFAGVDLGTRSPDAEDLGGSLPGPGFYCRMYRFDVTAQVTGNGSFDYSVTGTSAAFGDALVIVYHNANFPVRRIVINDGAENLLAATTTMTFDGMTAGLADLNLFTVADEAGGTESIDVNGAIMAGPGDILAASEGPYASQMRVAFDALGGMNSTSVTTGSDWLGLHVALMVSPFSCPAMNINYGTGHPGTLGVPGLTATGLPILGTSLPIDLQNSLGAGTPGLLLVGFSPASVPTSADGTILVTPSVLFITSIPAAGTQFTFNIRNQLELCGFPVFLQAVMIDPGASKGISFTPGLELDLGLP